MKIEDLKKLAADLFPYAFGAEMRHVDGKRAGFVKGYQYKNTKTFFNVHLLEDKDVEFMVKTLNDPTNTEPHKLVARIKYNSHIICHLTSKDETLIFSIYDDGGFELHRGEVYSTAKQLELNTKAVFEVYKHLTEELNYEIK